MRKCNDEIVNMVAKAGYKTATTVRKGRVNDKENLLELPRVAIRNRAIFPIFLSEKRIGSPFVEGVDYY
jgi:hypothetical protein